jgi:hypothetical protein
MKRNQNIETAQYKKLLKAYHQSSDRHVLVLETDLSYQDKCKVFHYADLERKAGNELISIMKKHYEQLVRTKKYRKFKKLYGKYSEIKDKKACKEIAKQMTSLQGAYHVTWEFCRKTMIPIGKKYGLDSIVALTKAEDVWKSVEKCLYSDGKSIHFAKKGELPTIRAKQINRGIILFIKENELQFKWRGFSFGVIVKDLFQKNEVDAILNYLTQPDVIDKKAVERLQKDGVCISTYRPCYAILVCKKIRGKLRVYVHITVEGVALPKYDRFGNLKHKRGKGKVGCDIGTQTIAYTSDCEVGLKNLAERGQTISTNERKERLIYRAMDRSRRAMNPQNYNTDGTVKKGRKIWKDSNRYRKLKAKHTELCRINAENRHFSINEDVNHLRSLGDVFVTESKNAKKLQKRAKNTTTNQKGKINRKKRFGKSIKNRCPGYFQSQVKKKFEITNGVYIEVPNDYRASQYDHTADDYIKKKLSDRMYQLFDGTWVQRDWYSSFLLYNINYETKTINRKNCITNFSKQYEKEKSLIEWIRLNKIKVLNSGIKVAY